ncbi:alpha/beta-hydrolase [Lojkania enalia]|uniref:Alpha/beta-hydrolase n=1 Tax=Lojkania enalia TaxID=147567 RepID=A0A9P4NAZ6_9PLEO|nr:alpha/beta-hydrolase [Didymosphaeria enalia]
MSGPCCAAGEIHRGNPIGNETKVHGLDCYVAKPPSNVVPRGVVVILPDVFGWRLVNSRILADNFAKKGQWLVYLPDLMNSSAAPPSLMASIHALQLGGFAKYWHLLKCIFYLIPFRWATRQSIVQPRISNFFQKLRENEAAHLPIGAAGYCWGGKWSTVLAHNVVKSSFGKPLVDATFTAHPSRLRIPSDIQKIQIPTSIAVAVLDDRFPPSQVDETEALLRTKTERGEGEHELIWYEGARHGFAVRGSKTDEVENQRGMQAEEQAVNWFKKIFAAVRYQ